MKSHELQVGQLFRSPGDRQVVLMRVDVDSHDGLPVCVVVKPDSSRGCQVYLGFDCEVEPVDNALSI